jgi:hypothetical protein
MGGELEARSTVAADTTPVAISSSLNWAQAEYMVVLFNNAAVGGTTAYVVASASDAAINGLSIPPQKTYLSGPYVSLPYLYAASSQNIFVQVLGYDAPTGQRFRHEDITVLPYQLGTVYELPPVDVISAANAGDVTLATATSGAVRVLSVNVVSDGATTGDLTSAAVSAGASKVNVLIDATDAAKANIDAADEQVAYDGGSAGCVLDANDTVVMSLVGTGATAVDLAVYIRYSPITDGAYMV